MVGLVDLLHVRELLLEVLLRVDESVEEVAVLAVLLRLEIEAVEKFEEALSELGDLDVGGHLFDLALDGRNLAVLVGELFLLLNNLVVLSFILSLDLAKNGCMLLLLHLLSPLLHLGKLLLQASLLLLAALLELGFLLAKSGFLFDES